MITSQPKWYRELPRLQEIRESQNLSRGDLSRFSSVTVQAIESLEAGQRKASDYMANRLAWALYVTVAELEGRS